ncbi:LysR substrate-binding domain-containing protein [Roseicyclus sp. F158]|uniref:LysR substrate-binding domain-containing protein n=1 Tax=Tropicimonas omnivorans TaxID=3075590 RepID=A0ABU3DEE2_9RHOB|nr:LysR substrate-binding domain-containing protein [Roseicyclus sp. F158]MDT0682087.1 LysR substrate-binding domain-containing protein [Roseicyclus sp. F158]
MNLRSLQLFRQIVLTGSLAEASRQLNVSSSAASRLLSLLESEINITLFSREKRQLILTDDGDIFYRRLVQTLDGLDEIPTLASDIRNRSHKRLSLVTAAPIARTLVSPALSWMEADGRSMQCSLNVETRFDIESKVAARGYNLGLISLPVENAILDVDVEPILEVGTEVLMPRDHPLAAHERVTVEDIAGERFVALRPGQRWRDRLDRLLGTTGHEAEVAVETSSSIVALQLVRDRLGITLTDRASVDLQQDDAAVLRPLADTHPITYAAIHAPGPRAPLATAFLDAVSEVVEARRAADPAAAAMLELI